MHSSRISCRDCRRLRVETSRLNKYLSAAGVCSRREADRLTQLGLVTIDGRVAVVGDQVAPGQEVRVRGKLVVMKDPEVLLAYYKPKGIVCTAKRSIHDNIIDAIGYPVRIYPIGRLDRDSEGLILMTNQGELTEKIVHARYCHEKEYLVRVDKPITEAFLTKMGNGVEILDTVTRPCTVIGMGKYTFSIILTQGLNRQIRRMCEALGYRVRELKRIRVMNIRLGDLMPGQYREIVGEEKEALLAALGLEVKEFGR
ncbi:MAG: pseudouridine synthase [Lachnospiraceae bacterium]|nr:pseudouridine synthase [Lachnospiraceae bacterium]